MMTPDGKDFESLSANGFPSSAYLGKGLGGEGSWETARWVDVEVEVGRAMHPEMKRVHAEAMIGYFMTKLCRVRLCCVELMGQRQDICR